MDEADRQAEREVAERESLADEARASREPAVVFVVIREYVRCGEFREKIVGIAATEDGAQRLVDAFVPVDGVTRSLDWVRFEVQP